MGEIVLANSLVEVAILGKGLKCPLETDPAHGDFKRLEGVENVKQCITEIISTRVGERVMNEDLGIQLPDLLFENREGIVDILPLRIVEAIRRFEPRVAHVAASAVPFEPNGVEANITWALRSTGARDNLVWPYYLSSGGSNLLGV